MKTMRILKNNLSAVLTITFIITACISVNVNGKTPTITKEFNVSSAGTLDVETSGGWIKVEGTDGNKVVVEVYVYKNGMLLSSDDSEVKDIEDGYDILISQEGERITAYAKKINNSSIWKRIWVAFKIQVPHEMSCLVKTSGGSIDVTAVKGMHHINTSGGSIDLSNIEGKTDAHTSGGSVNVNNLIGDANVSTSGGHISIEDCKGNIKANTSGGGINLENIEGRIDAHTSGGGIKINGNVGYVKATTSGGGIRMDITGLDEELYVETSGGSINATIPDGLGMDLDLKGNKVDIELQNFSGYAKEGKVQGPVNGGGIPVHMHTSGGNVNVYYN